MDTCIQLNIHSLILKHVHRLHIYARDTSSLQKKKTVQSNTLSYLLYVDSVNSPFVTVHQQLHYPFPKCVEC